MVHQEIHSGGQLTEGSRQFYDDYKPIIPTITCTVRLLVDIISWKTLTYVPPIGSTTRYKAPLIVLVAKISLPRDFTFAILFVFYFA